jgi:signal transduction histidine kinase
VRFTVTGAPSTLPPTRQTAVYRVVQEALTNVLKHGTDVTTVTVEMTWSAEALTVDICDDGRAAGPPGKAAGPPGAAVDPPPGDAGHGLTGMRERVSMHGGTMVAGPGRAAGWRVSARLPLEEAE